MPQPDAESESDQAQSAIIVQSDQGAAAPSRLLTRREAAELLGVSETTLRRREAEGLRPTMRGRTHMYEETLVRQMTTTMRRRWSGPAPMDGGIAADAFALLAEGVAPRDVVIRLRVPPEVIGRLCSQWADLGGGFFVTGEDAFVLGVRGVDEIHAAMKRASDAETRAELRGNSAPAHGTCRACGARAASICDACHATVRRAAFSRAVTAQVAHVERRVDADGSTEVRLVLEDCDVLNTATKRSVGGARLKTEWERASGPIHWSRVFPDTAFPSAEAAPTAEE